MISSSSFIRAEESPSPLLDNDVGSPVGTDLGNPLDRNAPPRTRSSAIRVHREDANEVVVDSTVAGGTLHALAYAHPAVDPAEAAILATPKVNGSNPTTPEKLSHAASADN